MTDKPVIKPLLDDRQPHAWRCRHHGIIRKDQVLCTAWGIRCPLCHGELEPVYEKGEEDD